MIDIVRKRKLDGGLQQLNAMDSPTTRDGIKATDIHKQSFKLYSNYMYMNYNKLLQQITTETAIKEFYWQDFLPGHALQDLYKSLSTKLTDVVWDPRVGGYGKLRQTLHCNLYAIFFNILCQSPIVLYVM